MKPPYVLREEASALKDQVARANRADRTVAERCETARRACLYVCTVTSSSRLDACVRSSMQVLPFAFRSSRTDWGSTAMSKLGGHFQVSYRIGSSSLATCADLLKQPPQHALPAGGRRVRARPVQTFVRSSATTSSRDAPGKYGVSACHRACNWG
jgi:hypothetical protein